VIGVERDLDVRSVAVDHLVDRVVDDLPQQVVIALLSVPPMYMPGRRRPGSRPSRTVMCSDVYEVEAIESI
jgi:hypothetical protein